MRAFIVFTMSIIMVLSSFQTKASAPPTGQGNSVFLKLLEPIAPQQTKDKDTQKKEGLETVQSTLGDLLKDPKNEALKDVKVIGTQKRFKTGKTHFTRVSWEEVALEVGKTPQGESTESEPIFLKEPVEKPLESSFVQKSDSIEAGTPVEAKGDVDSLLAAARTLMIRAQKKGLKGSPLSIKDPQNVGGGANASGKNAAKSSDLVPTQAQKKDPPGFDRTFQPDRAPSHASSSQNASQNSGGTSSYPRSSPTRQTQTSRSPHISGSNNPASQQPVSVTVHPPTSANRTEGEDRTQNSGSSEGTRSHGLSGFSDHIPRGGSNVQEERTSQPVESAPDVRTPVTRIDYDFQSCHPRIDWPCKQVVLQAKAITFKDDERISETECLDTDKRFAIQKDYNHADCHDQIDRKDTPTSPLDFGFAYATYRPYWLNASNERDYLKEPQRDEKHPFALQEEEGQCVYAIDLDARQAKPQSDLVYYNRLKQRVVIEPCRPSVFGKTTPLFSTTRRCGLVHQFDQNRSIQQKRLVYMAQGVEREALPCHDTGEWLNHKFDTKRCKPVVDESSKRQQPFAKRYVETETGKIYISECEPYGAQVPLGEDAEACRHQPYTHDVASGQSYANVRWYYERPQGRKYVTDCQPSTKAFRHEKKLLGYDHDDAHQISRPRIEVSFNHDGRKVIVIKSQVDETATPAPYARVGERTETTPYSTRMSDRCYQERRFKQKNLFRRVDGSEFEQAVQDRIDSVDLCVRTQEERAHTSRDTQVSGKEVRGKQKRTKTVYPDQSVEYTEWEWTFGGHS